MMTITHMQVGAAPGEVEESFCRDPGDYGVTLKLHIQRAEVMAACADRCKHSEEDIMTIYEPG